MIEAQEIKATNIAQEINQLQDAEQTARTQTIDSKNKTREALDRLEYVEENLNAKRIEEHELTVAIKFLQGKISFLETERDEVKKQIDDAENTLQALIKEQARHSNWDQYLQAKENFLIEQFKLLGVKYVVYNSR